MNSSQNKVLRRNARKGAAALSAITLALGSLSIFAPSDFAPEATAAELSGGIRDKSGAVEKDAQKASDLPAGSCTVSESTESGSQAGFSWSTSEPSASSPDKKAWGLSVSFDNSKDRTFADWSFTNNGRMGAYLDAAQIPAMNAGQTLVDKVVTHKADEILGITASGPQRPLNLNAKLTDAKVKQFAEATAANPVRYAWQGNYKQDNPGGPRATQGTNSSFTAVVNPWPSENIECNPITVSWENFEKHVIVAGAETKVGKINVPAVQNGGTDDSMSRMVVEAYDGNGQFIGTTDPAASGGTKNLRIDEATGDIYFTWPEYRGTDLATDKNVNFSVLAKPRTVDQLQAAGANNNEFGDSKAFDSSNSLTRYNKANVIDSKAFSLDDTEYHSPKYDKTDASIISGVDSATGPLATEPQKVTFTQTPDLIKDLAKKKGDGGYEAKVELDEKYVYDGWSVEMDENYNVTVTAPENPRPGTFARPKITVEYSNGSTDELELLVVVDPNNTQVTDLVRPGLTKGTIGDDLTAQVGTKSIMKGYKPVHPAKFEVDPATVPDGWTVTVDETGKVTAKADDTVAPGTIITPKIKATYPDQTTDEIETQFQAIVDIKIPTYDTVTNKPTAKVSLKPTLPERGLSGNTTDEAPKRYAFPEGKTEYTVEDDSGKWTVKIDENTGEITTTIPRTAPEGYILNVPVLAYYDNADKPQEVKGTVVVLKSDHTPTYSVESTGPNQAVNHQVQDAPKGSKFSFGNDENGAPITEQEVDGWKYTIDPNTGVVSSTPPANSKPGDKKTINVTVTTPDGSTPLVPVTTVVKLTNSWEAEPVVPSQTVYPGGTATSPIGVEKPAEINLAADKPFMINPEGKGLEATGENNEFGNPTYKVKTANGDWIVGLDDKGNVISTAPETAKPGDKIDVPVIVTYEDGSKDNTTATVNVIDVPKREVPFKVEYKYDDTIPAGTYKVETTGVPGAEKMKKDGTWERTKEPVNEVVVVGTKPAESAKDVTWKVPIPYPTEVRENPDLKPGETRVVQEGENGEKTYTAKFTAKGDEAEVVEEETTKEPVKRIVEYGPGLAPSELVTKTEKPIPFETEVEFDPNLPAGEKVVDQKGELGTEVVTSTQKLVDGKPSGDPTVTTERTKEPTTEKIRVGTKTTGENTETYKAEAPYKVVVKYDPNMPAGESKVTTKGEPGEKTVTVKRDIVNSKPGDPQITEEITKQPVDEVITVGTKPSEASEKVTWTAQVPFDVETRPNPELKPGEIKVVQKGVPGEKTYTADFTAKGDQATVTPEEKQTKDPVNEIIEYGPAAEDTSVVTKVEKPVPFETEIVFDDSLKAGEQVVDEQGELGTEIVTSTQKIKDGKPDGEPTVTTEQTKAPKNAKIRVGTKTTGEVTKTVESEVPFGVKVEFDPNLPAGTSEVVTEGKPGKKTTTVTQKVTNSQPDGEATVEEKITEQPVDQVIKVGTKPSEASSKVTWTAQVPFEVETRPNPELKPGEIKVVQKGVPGEKTYTADFTAKGDQATATPEEKQTKDPVKEIIEYGPAAEDTTVVTKVDKPVPFETEIVFDDTLEKGKQVVDQQGELGSETVTSTQKIKDGKPDGDPTVTTERTKEPTKRIIRVGTYDPAPSVEPKQVELPFTTKIIYDESLEPGQEVVDQEGENGILEVTVENGQPSVKTVKEPVEKIVRVGTKPAEGVEWTEEIAFEVEVVEDPDLEAGKVETVQQGKPGERVHNTDGTTEVRVEPVKHIIKVGTKCNCEDPKDPENPNNPEDPKDPENPNNPEDPKDPENPNNPEDPKPEDPKPEDPKDPNEPGGSTGSVTPKPSLPGIIGSLGIGGAIVGSGSHGSTPKPDPKQPGKPGTPNKPDSKQPGKPGKPGNADKPGTPGKSSTPSQPGSKGGTSTGSSASSGSSSSQKQVDSPRMSTLASTGANVLGVFAVGLALIIGAIPLLRRRREEGEA
ncbi:G5 domain-containing protein [Corynebacterium sp. ACRQJ]|uniref:G5 domain-containing protein n=2 Tax=Corynebacterium TaxID=1716 RepID=UPI001EF6DB17|nr:G5 domain-containing protein [Corynebacterium sp. ACRQJ]MCG7268174.1 G5 domain-containing protein [Corynebacterium sp. ACRQJ]